MAIRVTEPLNYFSEPWKLDWYAKNGKAYCNRVSKQAMKIGTRVDEIIKEKCSYVPYLSDYKKDTKEVHNCLEAFNKWWRVYNPTSITPCTRLSTTIEGVDVTGEPDIMVDNVLVDIKCSSRIDLKYWIQVNMYRSLKNSAHGLDGLVIPTQKVGILRLDKQTASYEYVLQDYSPSLCDVWVGLMRAYVLFNKEVCDGVDIREEAGVKEVA